MKQSKNRRDTNYKKNDSHSIKKKKKKSNQYILQGNIFVYAIAYINFLEITFSYVIVLTKLKIHYNFTDIEFSVLFQFLYASFSLVGFSSFLPLFSRANKYIHVLNSLIQSLFPRLRQQSVLFSQTDSIKLIRRNIISFIKTISQYEIH